MAIISIPWGLVNGKVKAVNEITEKDKDNITCMHCGEKLILKAINSEYKVKHLSHRPDSNCPFKSHETLKKSQICESYEHKYVKLFLKDNLKYFREKGIKAELINGEFKLTGYRDLKIKEIKIEEYLTQNYKPDLTIITDKKIICLEIYKTNKKDQEKIKEALNGMPVSVYEVDINGMNEITIQNIFKKMKLIYSDMKNVHDTAIEVIHDMIINHKAEINQLKNDNGMLEAQKEVLEGKLELYEYGSKYESKHSSIYWNCKKDGANLFACSPYCEEIGGRTFDEIDSILFEEEKVNYTSIKGKKLLQPVIKSEPRVIYGAENIKKYLLGEDEAKAKKQESMIERNLVRENQSLKEDLVEHKAEINKRGDKIFELESKIKELTKYGDIENMNYIINMLKLRLGEKDYDVKTGEFIS